MNRFTSKFGSFVTRIRLSRKNSRYGGKCLPFFNETVDDKRLGLWLKSSLESHKDCEAHEKVKEEILSTLLL